MYKQVEKSKEKESKAVANSDSKKTTNLKQGFQFVDNRPEALIQRRLIEEISKCNKDISSRSSDPLQLKVKTYEKNKSKQLIHLNANGFRDDFSAGDPAGDYGYNGVEKYKATYKINDNPLKETQVLSNNYLAAHAGHILANQNGGYGDADNVFAQDGGVNTTNEWPSFEHSMRKDLDSSPQDADVDFNMYFYGNNITKGKLDRDHMPKMDFSEAQKKFFGIK